MIQRFLLLLCAVLLSSTAIAGDLKLRVATLGYEDAREASDAKGASDDQSQTILRSIETQIRPGLSFSTSCRYGTEKIELRGSATHDENSKLKVSLYYRHEKLSFDGTAIQTTLSLKPGDSLAVGGVTSVTTSKGQDSKTTSEYQIVVSLIDSDESKREADEASDEPKSR